MPPRNTSRVPEFPTGQKWMERTAALDLRLQAACRMHRAAPPPVAMETGGPDEQASATFDPLFYEADAAIELISRCEVLLEKRRADLARQADS